MFGIIGGPDLGNCAVPIHILVAVDGAIEVEAVGLKLIDAIADFNVGVDSASESALILRVTSAMADAFASEFSKAVSMEFSLLILVKGGEVASLLSKALPAGVVGVVETSAEGNKSLAEDASIVSETSFEVSVVDIVGLESDAIVAKAASDSVKSAFVARRATFADETGAVPSGC